MMMNEDAEPGNAKAKKVGANIMKPTVGWWLDHVKRQTVTTHTTYHNNNVGKRCEQHEEGAKVTRSQVSFDVSDKRFFPHSRYGEEFGGVQQLLASCSGWRRDFGYFNTLAAIPGDLRLEGTSFAYSIPSPQGRTSKGSARTNALEHSWQWDI